MPPRWWAVFRLVTGKRTYYWALCRNAAPYWPDALGGCTVRGVDNSTLAAEWWCGIVAGGGICGGKRQTTRGPGPV